MEDKKKPVIFVGIRISVESRERLEEIANKERRSLSKQIEYLIMEYTDEQLTV